MFAQLLSLVWRTPVLFAVLWPLGGPEIRAAAPALEEAKQEQPAYAIVAERKSVEDAPWKSVVEALQKKHSAKVFFRDDGGTQGLQEKLSAFCPDYVCFCFADGMLYLFGERGGQAGLATCSPEGMEMKGTFNVEGDGPSWAYPVVIGGRLYLRYDENLYCFNVR